MRLILLLLLPILAACDSPSVAFMGVPAQRMEVEGSVFSMRIDGDRVESIRVSREVLPSRATILARAEQAIAQASGCEVRGIDGDQAIQRARLKCPDG